MARLLSETVARQLLFILITVDDELNAFTVFETLNSRRLELTTTDLLKNYLFSLVRVRADLEALQRRWRALVATVEQERFPEFLRFHLLCELPRVRGQRLFKLIRDRTTTPQDVFALLDELERRAELFAAVSDPNHDYWTDLPAAKAYVRELNLFRVRQATPLLFTAWESFRDEDFVRVLRLVSAVSFRVHGSQRPQRQRTRARIPPRREGRWRRRGSHSGRGVRAPSVDLRGRPEDQARLLPAGREHRRAAKETGQVHPGAT